MGMEVVFRGSFIGLVAVFLLSSCVSFTSSASADSTTPFTNELDLTRWELGHVSGRSLLQTTVPTSNGSLVLAANRTHRRDPLHSFHYYTGGWNIKNESYWSSLGYTGLPGFVLAVIWLALGLLLLLLFCCCCCCCWHRVKREHDHGAAGYYIPLFLLLLFTAAAIGGCYTLFYGQQKFHNELESTLNYAVNQSYSTVQGLNNVSSYLSQASTINVEGTGLPTSEIQSIQSLNVQIASAANSLQNKTESNAHNINNIIDDIRLALIIVSAVMLALVILGLVFSACGVRPIVYFLVVVGWILVVCTWILCAIFIMLHNAMGDTCVAMQQWVANPTANTSLDNIIPCVNPQTGANTLLQSKAAVYTLTSNANTAISTVVNSNNSRLPAPLFYNQSGPAVPELCNPYGPAPNYTDAACATGTVSSQKAPGVWAAYICPSSNGTCTGQGRLTQTVYNQLATTANVSYGLSNYGPFLVDLEDCTTVRNTFSAITTNNCPNLNKWTKWVWIGLAIVSAGSMLSILLWMIYIRRRNMRYGKNRDLNRKGNVA